MPDLTRFLRQAGFTVSEIDYAVLDIGAGCEDGCERMTLGLHLSVWEQVNRGTALEIVD